MFGVANALLASFGQKARKLIMRSTAYARYRTTNGHYGKLIA